MPLALASESKSPRTHNIKFAVPRNAMHMHLPIPLATQLISGSGNFDPRSNPRTRRDPEQLCIAGT